MTLSPRVRFAPSPTGFLHLGNARTALVNWLFARSQGGHLLLRIDDTDQERSKDIYTEAIKKDLTWLGLDWDASFAQSSRKDVYQDFVDKLKESGHLYPCYETPEDLEKMRADLLTQGKPPLYRKSNFAQKTSFPHWRFSLVPREVTWHDAIQGPMAYHTAHISDPVVVRQDGSISYLLSSVIDDVTTQMTHILRGADHITNTAIQIEFFHALKGVIPVFAHFPLISSQSGHKFSKRLSSLTIHSLKEDGFLPLALCQALASLGHGSFHAQSLEAMAQAFRLSDYNNKAVRMMDDHIQNFNQTLIRTLSWKEIMMFDFYGFQGLTEEIWSVIAANVDTLLDISFWVNFFSGQKEKGLDNPQLATQALALLPASPWDIHTWSAWLEALGGVRPEKKGALAKSLRHLLTGKETGPRMDSLLLLLGEENVRAYLT